MAFLTDVWSTPRFFLRTPVLRPGFSFDHARSSERCKKKELLLRKSGPGLAAWRDNPPQTPMRRRGYTAFGGACFRGAGPGSMAQTSARRSAVTRTGRRRRASEDVARE